MIDMPLINPKARQTALDYIPNILRVCLNDCSDSGTESDRLHARFDAFVDDSMSIGEYIKTNLLSEWREQAVQAIADAYSNVAALSEDGWPVCEPPAPLNDTSLLD